MPKATFNHLPAEKKAFVRGVLLHIFAKQPLSQVKVSEIVHDLQMSRGIFYKYFEDLNDAYDYLIKDAANKIHGRILQQIARHHDDFFAGLAVFLTEALAYDPASDGYKELQLLTQNSYLFSYRSEDPHGAEAWQKILTANHFNIKGEAEAMSFLYFSMKLVIDSLTDAYANEWTAETLLQDFDYKVSWLKRGIQS
ncbi:TetR/AcrR family transcriptional regulator [Enterococcus sp.]|uniref:TetR/AcrR family transcriptional regulator n=1 Tax=Enterococcus sp. TaxID=35783 RepID=UPI0028A60119|nr:TetR/AcrR family transcriptional regulator [Enterococcus sp.]